MTDEAIDVRYLEQLSENGQTTALAHMMSWILDNVKAEEDIQHIIERMYTIIRKTRNGSNYTSQLLRRSSCFTKKAGVICVS